MTLISAWLCVKCKRSRLIRSDLERSDNIGQYEDTELCSALLTSR